MKSDGSMGLRFGGGAAREPHRLAPRQGVMDLLRGWCISTGILLLGLTLGACTAIPGTQPKPQAICAGMQIAIPGALSCDQVAAIALNRLAQAAPERLAHGVSSIKVVLLECPRDEMPPTIDCTGEQFAQMVTVNFVGGNDKLDPLTVAVGPVSGRVLGISNPLIR